MHLDIMVLSVGRVVDVADCDDRVGPEEQDAVEAVAVGVAHSHGDRLERHGRLLEALSMDRRGGTASGCRRQKRLQRQDASATRLLVQEGQR